MYLNHIVQCCITFLSSPLLPVLCLFPTGPSGSVISLTGSGFGNDSQLISVTINKVPCNVSLVSNTQIQCITGDNPGGTYPVVMHHQVKGDAQSYVVFTYALTLSSVQPSEGEHTFRAKTSKKRKYQCYRKQTKITLVTAEATKIKVP